MIRSETGFLASGLSAAILEKIIPTPFIWGSPSLGFPEYRMVFANAVRNNRRVFHLISLTPRIVTVSLDLLHYLGTSSLLVYTTSIPWTNSEAGDPCPWRFVKASSSTWWLAFVPSPDLRLAPWRCPGPTTRAWGSTLDLSLLNFSLFPLRMFVFGKLPTSSSTKKD